MCAPSRSMWRKELSSPVSRSSPTAPSSQTAKERSESQMCDGRHTHAPNRLLTSPVQQIKQAICLVGVPPGCAERGNQSPPEARAAGANRAVFRP